VHHSGTASIPQPTPGMNCSAHRCHCFARGYGSHCVTTMAVRQAGNVAKPVRYIVVANRLLFNLKSQRVYKVCTTSRSPCPLCGCAAAGSPAW